MAERNDYANKEEFGKGIANGIERLIKRGQAAVIDAVIASVKGNIGKMSEQDTSAIQISHSIVSPLMHALGYNLADIELAKLFPGTDDTVIGIVRKQSQSVPFVIEIRPFGVSTERVLSETTDIAQHAGAERIIVTNGKKIQSSAITETKQIVSLCSYALDSISAKELIRAVNGIQDEDSTEVGECACNPFSNIATDFGIDALTEKASNAIGDVTERISESCEHINQKAADFLDNCRTEANKLEKDMSDEVGGVPIPIAIDTAANNDKAAVAAQGAEDGSLEYPEWKKILYCEGEIFFIMDEVIDDSVAAATVENGYLRVLKNSRFVPFADPNLPPSAQKVRGWFMQNSNPSECELINDVYCWKAHPSAIASAIVGERTDGWNLWVNESGETIAERSRARYGA